MGYVGAPGHGKTYLGFQHLKRLALDRKPALVIESVAGESHFAGIEKVDSVEDAVHRVWYDGKHTAFTPKEPEEVEALARAVLAGKDVHFFIDEIAFWLTSHRGSQSDLTRLFRSYRHARSTIQFTTQHFSGDIPQEVISCNVELFIFRSLSMSVAERLEKTYGIDSKEVMNLPKFKYFHVIDGKFENNSLAQSKPVSEAPRHVETNSDSGRGLLRGKLDREHDRSEDPSSDRGPGPDPDLNRS